MQVSIADDEIIPIRNNTFRKKEINMYVRNKKYVEEEHWKEQAEDFTYSTIIVYSPLTQLNCLLIAVWH